ncbi:MAG: hypothetical protein ACK4PR_11300 [Gammaproteobacteria bacterium]
MADRKQIKEEHSPAEKTFQKYQKHIKKPVMTGFMKRLSKSQLELPTPFLKHRKILLITPRTFQRSTKGFLKISKTMFTNVISQRSCGMKKLALSWQS